jgi:hypothetical protein
MPNGNEIEVGSRLPWFSTVPLGTYQSRSADDFQLGPNEQAAQFLPPTECDVEVHDAYSNCIANLGAGQSSFLIKLTDMGAHTYWTPAQALVLALFGQEGNVTPARPFMKPYLLKKGHRIQATVQNNTGATIESPVMALRGVRLCEY